jgi:hypothetical protein
VHEYFNEKCVFFLLRGHDPHQARTFSDALRELLHNIDIGSHSVDVVFGEVDALVRMWVTNEARDRFLRHLTMARSSIDQYREFDCVSVHYGFSDSRPAGDPGDFEAEIRCLVRADRLGEPDAEADSAIDTLHEAGLLVRVDPSPGVKVYLVLRAGADMPLLPQSLTHELATASAEAGLSNVSIYRGNGFADLLLKGVVPQWDTVLDSVNGLRRIARTVDLDPFTLVVGNYGRRNDDGETIDSLLVEGSRWIDAFLDRVDDPLATVRQSVSALTQTERDGLDILCRAIARSQPYRPGAQATKYSILTKCLLRQFEEVDSEALSIAQVEVSIRRLLPRLLSGIAGRNWLEELKRAGLKAGVSEADRRVAEEDPLLANRPRFFQGHQGPNDWLLFDLLQALSVAADRWPAVNERLSTTLPKSWREARHRIVTVRNLAVHFGLSNGIANVADFADDEWRDRILDVFTGIDMLAGLRQLIQAQ